jgi:hypothetical protein
MEIEKLHVHSSRATPKAWWFARQASRSAWRDRPRPQTIKNPSNIRAHCRDNTVTGCAVVAAHAKLRSQQQTPSHPAPGAGLEIPRIIPIRRSKPPLYALTCDCETVRYPCRQIARVWFCRMWTIAKVRLAWVTELLPVPHHVADLILVPSSG